jgi:hypothetical protein
MLAIMVCGCLWMYYNLNVYTRQFRNDNLGYVLGYPMLVIIAGLVGYFYTKPNPKDK